MRELVGRVPLLGYDRVQQARTKMAHLAKVTGRRDCKTFSLASACYFVSIFPRVLECAIYLFLVAFVLLPVTRWSRLNIRVAEKPAAFPNFTIPSGHVVVASVFPNVVSCS